MRISTIFNIPLVNIALAMVRDNMPCYIAQCDNSNNVGLPAHIPIESMHRTVPLHVYNRWKMAKGKVDLCVDSGLRHPIISSTFPATHLSLHECTVHQSVSVVVVSDPTDIVL